MDFSPPAVGAAANSAGIGGVMSQRSYAVSGKIMLTAVVILFAVVLFIVFLHLYIRWHIIHRASRRRRSRIVFAGEGQASPPDAANRGLDPSILKSLPLLPFTSIASGSDDELFECAVCLNEFKEGEKIRCLPRCGHRFHIECIDMWFSSHSTCPLCRATVEAVKEAVPPVSGPDPLAIDVTGAIDSSCRREEDIGSSSSGSSGCELRIELPGGRTEGFDILEEDLNLGCGSPREQLVKSPGSRILLVRWLLMCDPRLNRGGNLGIEPDLECGGGAPPLSPPAPAPDR